MSEELTLSVFPSTVSQRLCYIDEQCEDGLDLEVRSGPFGAFNSIGQIPPNVEMPWVGSPSEEVTAQAGAFNDAEIEDHHGPLTDEAFDAVVVSSDQSSCLTSLCIQDYFGEPGTMQEIYDGFPMFAAETDLLSSTPSVMNDFAFPSFFDREFLSGSPGLMSMSMATRSTTDSSIPHDAVLLIKHYSTRLLNLLTPFRHSKTPWHVLFVPHVKSCLAALTLGEEMDDARLCAFYATLSVSAFSLGGVSQSNMWLKQGENYLRIARNHAKAMLQTAYDVPKAAKYKAVLIALLSMVHVALVTGNRDQTECYFVEAEKFIRVKGLNRTKSRKVRMLHHCYVFERMFHESTFLGSSKSNHRQHTRKAIESSGAVIYSKDGLSFRIADWSNLELQMQQLKSSEEGENDLHLEKPGVWPQTLYPEIFGIPEDYMFALSLVIRLGEWKDSVADALSLRDFLEKAKIVERHVKNMGSSVSVLTSIGKEFQHDSDSALANMLNAMQNALGIYFYRRIYDIDASLLQKKVSNVAECLQGSIRTEPNDMYGSTRLLWPAFIAACEAEKFSDQISFSTWFQSSYRQSGLRYFENARETAERIWAKKSSTAGESITWSDYLNGALIHNT